MTPERWHQISAIFSAATQREPADQTTFVIDACNGDDALRREVTSLLTAHQDAAGFGSSPLMPSSQRFQSGSSFGGYRIETLLGAGGMGLVYRARDTQLERDVALKVLPPLFEDDPERAVRFEGEARILAGLNHPNIATIHSVTEEDGVRALVMELVEGTTLSDRISAGPIDVLDALAVAKQIAEALEAAHEVGIVHCDLKPGNIKIRPDGRVKVLDFGLAMISRKESHEPALSRSATTKGGDAFKRVVVGTAAYMSPEQVRGELLDQRTDIWAFGCVLFEMLAGKRVFDGADDQEKSAAILTREPDWAALPAATPAHVSRSLKRCLQKDRTLRLRDIGDARLELTAWAEVEDATKKSSFARFPGWGLVAGALLVVLVVPAIAFLYLRPAPESEEKTARFTVSVPAELTMNMGSPASVSLAISPNGRLIVYNAGPRSGTAADTRLWIRSLDTLEGRPLSGTEGGLHPFWSPDSRSIGFFAQGKLKRIDVSSGGPQELSDVSIPRLTHGGTWGRDGTIVFSPDRTAGLLRIPATGGQPSAATTLDAPAQSHRWPFFLPDGRHFLYSTWPETAIYVGSLDSPERSRLTSSDSKAIYASGYLLFVRQSTLFAQRFEVDRLALVGDAVPVAEQVQASIAAAAVGAAFSASEHGELVYRTGRALGGFTGQLTWFDRTGKALGTVWQPGDFRGLEIEDDERRITVHPHDDAAGGGDSVLVDLRDDRPSRLTFAGHTTATSWSPDGSRIAFGSNRPASGPSPTAPYAGIFNLYVKRSDGVGDATLLLDGAAAGQTLMNKRPTDWSPDGTLLVYTVSDPKTGWDLWALPLSGDRKPWPLVNSASNEVEGQISPDGRWLAYTSDERKRWDVYVKPLSGGEGKWQVSPNSGRFPRWRGDSKELFYLTQVPVRGKVMAVDVASAGAVFSAGTPRGLFDATFPGVFFPTFAGPIESPQFPYVVTQDGTRFLIIRDTSQPTTEPPITVVMNWPGSLPK